MRARNLIVLGGGEDQLPAYVEGRRLGYRVIGVDQRPDALGAALADEFLAMTTRDAEAIAARLGPIDVAAVMSPASDTAQPAVATLSRIYATRHQPAPLAVWASIDKGYFRSVVDRLGLPAYRHAEAGDTASLLAASAGMCLPMIVKPVDASGSKGLEFVDTRADLAAAIARVWPHSFARRATVEEVVDGRHCSVESFLAGGKVGFMVVTDRTLTPPPFVISTSHLIPADLDEDVLDRLAGMISMICGELGVADGPVNLDFVLHSSGDIYLIEMGARLGGNGLPLLVEQVYGVRTVEAAIRLAVGEPFDVTQKRSGAALLVILHSAVDGVLTNIGDLDTVRRMPDVLDVRTFIKVGEPVRAYTQAAHKIGYLIVVAPTRDELVGAHARAMAALDLQVTTNRRLPS